MLYSPFVPSDLGLGSFKIERTLILREKSHRFRIEPDRKGGVIIVLLNGVEPLVVQHHVQEPVGIWRHCERVSVHLQARNPLIFMAFP